MSIRSAVRFRAREYAKLALRDVLYRRHLDLVSEPHPARVAATLGWLGIDCVLDVGANIGQYASALRASGFGGRIISCEPLPDAYAVLSRRSRRDTRWTALQSAVGDKPGQVEINISANSYSSSLLPMAKTHLDAAPGSEFIGSVEVSVTTVASLVSQHAIEPSTSMLKVDTQGFESQVLDGAGEWLPQFAAVQLEMSFVALYAGQVLYDGLLERMLKCGFRLHGLDPGFSDPQTGRTLQADVVFVKADR